MRIAIVFLGLLPTMFGIWSLVSFSIPAQKIMTECVGRVSSAALADVESAFKSEECKKMEENAMVAEHYLRILGK